MVFVSNALFVFFDDHQSEEGRPKGVGHDMLTEVRFEEALFLAFGNYPACGGKIAPGGLIGYLQIPGGNLCEKTAL